MRYFKISVKKHFETLNQQNAYLHKRFSTKNSTEHDHFEAFSKETTSYLHGKTIPHGDIGPAKSRFFPSNIMVKTKRRNEVFSQRDAPFTFCSIATSTTFTVKD